MTDKKLVRDIPSYMNKKKGLILTITVIFVIILVLMAGVVLVLMTNHARVTETQIRRVRGVEAAESAALVQAYEELRTGNCIPSACGMGRTPGNFTTTIDNLTVTVATRAPGVSGCSTPNGLGSCVVANVTYLGD